MRSCGNAVEISAPAHHSVAQTTDIKPYPRRPLLTTSPLPPVSRRRGAREPGRRVRVVPGGPGLPRETSPALSVPRSSVDGQLNVPWAPEPSFHTTCLQEEISREITEVVVGAVDSVDSARLGSSPGVAAWGRLWDDSRMNRSRLWRPKNYPTFILESSSSSPLIQPLLYTLCVDRWTTGGFLEDLTRIPRGIHRPDRPFLQLSTGGWISLCKLWTNSCE